MANPDSKAFYYINNENRLQVRSLVTSVKWARDQWNVTYIKTDTKERHTASCDFVVIASGQYNAPKWPEIEGIEIFEGCLFSFSKVWM